MDIIGRIGQQLKVLFPDMTIYRKNQKGGFKEPSFFVSKITTTRVPELFGRQKRGYQYQLVYFPNPDDAESDMERMEDQLLDGFTQLDDFAPICDLDFQIVDGALTATFSVNVWAYPEDHTPKQRTLEYHGGIADDKQV
ncbi:DUF6838 family protein [Levilactobacillus namurensis]|uniref:phage tail terminator family protein n=1 Tax=Levilactobacillus namurensis TaxID=380393 RepID=UPI000551C447